MNTKNRFSLGVPTLDLRINPFSNGPQSEIYGTSAPEYNGMHTKPLFSQRVPTAPTNNAPPPTNNAVQFQHPATASSLRATLNVNSWLQQHNSDLLMQISQQGNAEIPGLAQSNTTRQGHAPGANSSPPSSMPISQGVTSSANLLPQLSPINRDYARMAKKLKSWNLQLTDQLTMANQQLRSSHDAIADLKYRLAEQERSQVNQKGHPAVSNSNQSYATSPGFDRSVKRFAARPYELTMVATSPTKISSPTMLFGVPSTPTKNVSPPTPQQPPKRSGRRHHRTATPEQRAIRNMMGGKPVFTMGIGPQNDRCLFFDFFEHVKKWAATYTVHIKSLNAEQIHNLAAHPAIARSLGKSSQLTMLVTEKDVLIAMVAGVVSRHMWTHALDEHSLYASGHPQAEICEELAYQWTRLDHDAHEAKHDLLLAQQQMYTSIKNAPDHKTWRTACAEDLTAKLLSDLTGLLATNLSPVALTERNHVLSELYVKGYRIGFRLRMAAVKWQFQWPSSGVEFDPSKMVNENRMLYGDVLRTMTAVMNEPWAHEARFAMSPTVTSSDFSVGGEKRVVAHHAMVHITRKGWA